MSISVQRIDQYVLDMDLRMPFHFGNTTLTQLPHLFVEAELEGDGGGQGGHSHSNTRGATGVAAEGLSPLWFLKDPGVTFEGGLDRTFEVIDSAVDLAQSIEAESVFAYWLELYDRQRAWAEDTDHPPLLWSFGVSLVERAVIDAFCRSQDTTFGDAVRENTLGIELGAVYDELEGTAPNDYLPAEPRRSTAVRHTVGFTDPLTVDELEADDRLDDGLPQALETYVRDQGVSHFKVKLSGDVDDDVARLGELSTVLERVADEYVLTLDANEQYGDAASFERDWEQLTDVPVVADLFESLLYVEQPLARGDALTAETKRTFSAWDDRPPLIIDESDGELRSLERALTCGYVGTSHKNCKGVFKGVINACLLEHRRREDSSREYVISGEDLSTVGPVSLPQDLAVMATLGTDHVERNGHHYFHGMSMLPADLQSSLLAAHGDLYYHHEDGFPTLAIDDGDIDLGSVVDAPFGSGLDLERSLDLEAFTPRSAWTFEPS